MRVVFPLALVCILGTVVAAPVPKPKAKTLEQKLIGTWKLVPENGKNLGYTLYLEYKAGGAMEIRYEFTGNQLPPDVYAGTYQAIDPDAENKLGSINWSVTEDGRTRSEVAKITQLTDDELTEVDPKGVVEVFVRVKELAKSDK